MVIRLGAFIALLVCATVSTGDASDVQAYRTGRTFVAGCVADDLDFCTGYVAGVVDVFAALYTGTGSAKFRMCIPAGVTPLMLARTVVEWIDTHGTLDQDAAGSVASAIFERYPCATD